MRKPVTVITAYVLEKLDSEPLSRRVHLLRCLAEVSPTERAALTSMADELEAIQQRHEQLLLNLKQGGRRA